jgi:1H-pyrrole-2-carbonyl-[peptidyl-carrier protein] chlorinase
VHAWYADVDRGNDNASDHIHIYFLKVERGRVWQIPNTNKINSMGVVVDKIVFRESFSDLELFFNNLLQTNSDLAHAMRNAKRVNEFKTEGDYS